VALHFEGTEFVEAVSSSATGGALRIEAVDGVIAETRIPVRQLPSTASDDGRGPSV
jgi:hypothetical protein